VPDRLPASCISTDTAAAVLFVGKAVMLLRNPGGEFRSAGAIGVPSLLPQQDSWAAAQVRRGVARRGPLTLCGVCWLRTEAMVVNTSLVVQRTLSPGTTEFVLLLLWGAVPLSLLPLGCT
jgi:hypothetical protein